jgi:hypothetical protein
LACPAWGGWQDVLLPRPYLREFPNDAFCAARDRDDGVIRVAHNRDDSVTIEQIVTDFGFYSITPPHKWMHQADIDAGTKLGRSTGESRELRDARCGLRTNADSAGRHREKKSPLEKIDPV